MRLLDPTRSDHTCGSGHPLCNGAIRNYIPVGARQSSKDVMERSSGNNRCVYALSFACTSDDANEYDVLFLLTNSNAFFITCDIIL